MYTIMIKAELRKGFTRTELISNIPQKKNQEQVKRKSMKKSNK